MRAIFGADRYVAGDVEVFGKKINGCSINKVIKNGIGYVPEDRKAHGIIANLTLCENISLGILDKISRLTWVNKKREKKIVEDISESLKIKCQGLSHLVGQLSGGNQQKAVLAKWLVSDVNILILDEPTRGIDVGAKHEIYMLMNELCKKGISIIMISSEMPEVLGMCDRVIVMAEGKITAELNGDEIQESKILQAAFKRRHIS